MISKGKLAQIHIAKAQLGLADDEYRAVLARTAGVASAKDLNDNGVSRVLNEFKRLGWVPKPARKAKRAAPRPPRTRERVMSKVEALLAEAGRPWAYADGMAKHMFKVERVDWLDDDQLQRLMQALIIDAKRRSSRSGRTPDHV